MKETGGWEVGGEGRRAKDSPPPHLPELDNVSKDRCGSVSLYVLGRGGLELVEIMNLGGFVFQVYLYRGSWPWDTSPLTMTDDPGKLPIRKDNQLQVFMGTGGLGSFGRRLLNKSDGNNEVRYHVDDM